MFPHVENITNLFTSVKWTTICQGSDNNGRLSISPFSECPKSSLTIGSIRSLYNGNIVAVWSDRRHAIGTLGYNVADSQARVVNSIYRPLHHTDRETLFTCKSSEKKTAARPHRGEVSRSLSHKCRVSKTTEKPGQRLPVLMAILRKLSMPRPGSC